MRCLGDELFEEGRGPMTGIDPETNDSSWGTSSIAVDKMKLGTSSCIVDKMLRRNVGML